MSGRAGVVIWFTGLPASGKSTIARRVAAYLRGRGASVIVLDGDEVRASMRPAPGYDDDARDAFYETLARLAALCASQDLVTLVPATANRRAYRERGRQLGARFVEVFVDTPLEECVRRDPKGLYAQAERDRSLPLPGAGMTYEPPEHPDIVARPDTDGAIEAIAALAWGDETHFSKEA